MLPPRQEAAVNWKFSLPKFAFKIFSCRETEIELKVFKDLVRTDTPKNATFLSAYMGANRRILEKLTSVQKEVSCAIREFRLFRKLLLSAERSSLG